MTIKNEMTALNGMNALLGLFLLASPWLLGFVDLPEASRNAWAAGGIVLILAVAAIAALREWEEWINVALGLWIAVSPWLLGFAMAVTPRWTHVGVGIAVAALAAIELWLIHGTPTARTTT
jgi:hypothetical protein